MQDYKIKFVSGNTELVFSPRSVCRILSGGLEGFDSPEFDVSVQNSGFFDGGFAYQRRICPRDMSIRFEVADRGLSGAVRDKVVKMMNPHNECMIISDFSGRIRKTDVIPCGMPVFEHDSLSDFLCIKLSFIAPYPVFYDFQSTKMSNSDAVPLFSFPLNLMKDAGTVCGMTGARDTFNIFNKGDIPCGFEAVLTSLQGYVQNPVISMGDKFIKVDGTIAEGDVLTIDTRYSSKKILYNGLSSCWYGVESTFFSLEPGENNVVVSAESGAENLHAAFEFSPLYLSA